MIRHARCLMMWALLLCATVTHAGTVTYVYTDPQGTPLAEADANGNITARFEYTPYGVSVASMGAAPNGVGYTGHVNDPESGFVYMQARYYDPVVGRFLSVDPVMASGSGDWRHFNRYAYAYDNPNKFTDPDGRCPICIGVILYLTLDNANAPGANDTPVSMSTEEKISAVANVLPPVRATSIIKATVDIGRKAENISQRAAAREAKRRTGIPTSQQPSSQSNGRAPDGTQVGRQQTYEVSKPGGGTETKSVQVSRDTRGDHAGMTQIEAGSVKPGGQVDSANRPRLQNEGKVRVDFDPEQ